MDCGRPSCHERAEPACLVFLWPSLVKCVTILELGELFESTRSTPCIHVDRREQLHYEGPSDPRALLGLQGELNDAAARVFGKILANDSKCESGEKIGYFEESRQL